MEAKNLLNEYRSVVKSIAKKHYFSLCDASIDIEDLMQIGFVGLLKACKAIDCQKNIKQYLYLRINGEVIDFIRSALPNYRKKRDYSVYCFSCLSFNEQYYLNQLDNNELLTEEQIDKEEQLKCLYKLAKRKLTQKEQFIFFELMNGEKKRSIAKHCKISESRVTQISRSICRKLSVYFK